VEVKKGCGQHVVSLLTNEGVGLATNFQNGQASVCDVESCH
jgi:hypothetical protein